VQTWNWTLIILGIAAVANLTLAYIAFRVIREARKTQLHTKAEAETLQRQTVLLNRPIFVVDRVFRFSFWEEAEDAEQGISVRIRNVRPHPAIGMRYRLKFFILDQDRKPDLIRESTGTLTHPIPEGESVHLHTPKNPWFGMPGIHYLGIDLEYQDPLQDGFIHQDFTLYLRLMPGREEIPFEHLCDLLLADRLRNMRMGADLSLHA
jgi:hypothetical protein